MGVCSETLVPLEKLNQTSGETSAQSKEKGTVSALENEEFWEKEKEKESKFRSSELRYPSKVTPQG